MTRVVHTLSAPRWLPLCQPFSPESLEERSSILWIQEARIKGVKRLAHNTQDLRRMLSVAVCTQVLLARLH